MVASNETASKSVQYEYPDFVKQLDSFELTIKAGKLATTQIVVLLGENGTGKTTFIRILAGSEGKKVNVNQFS